MKTYREFVSESNNASQNIMERGGFFRGLLRGGGSQWARRAPEVITGLVGLNRIYSGATRPEGPRSPEAYKDYMHGALTAMPFGSAVQNAIKLGSLGVEGLRFSEWEKRELEKRKKEEEKKRKELEKNQ